MDGYSEVNDASDRNLRNSEIRDGKACQFTVLKAQYGSDRYCVIQNGWCREHGEACMLYSDLALNPQLLGSESKRPCPLGIPSGASRSYWNPTPKTASHHVSVPHSFDSHPDRVWTPKQVKLWAG